MEKNSSKISLCVFPTDPIQAYFDKGEIKLRYFNPNNLFDEIHVISIFDTDIEPSKVKEIAGNAKLFIHPIGKINLKNYKKKLTSVIKKVQEINPHIIRAYNPLIQGWLATKCANELNIPLVVSLHINYDKDKHTFSKDRGLFYFLKMRYVLNKIEPYVIQNADRIICVHKSVSNFAKRLGAKKIEIIYNRVYLDQFSNHAEKALELDKPVIIFVARLAKSKNQECLIKAIKDMDVILLLIGDGPNYQPLINLVSSLNCNHKVKFIKSVPNAEIPKYYASADIFAASVIDKGIGISFLEAMASGLPTVLRKVPGEHEELEDAAYMVDNNPESFKKALKEILSNQKLRDDLRQKSLEMAQKLNGKAMEKKEEELYLDLLKSQNNSRIQDYS